MVLDANGQSAAYSPLTIAALPLPLPAAFTFWAAARLFLCLAGTWLWLCELGVSRRAAGFGAVAFAFSISMTAWLGFPQTAVLCQWPWILFAIERLREPDARRRAVALLTMLFFLQPLSGHLETVASFSAFTALWLAVRWAAGDRGWAAPAARAIAERRLLAIGLSAFSLLPQALAIRSSNRLALVEKPFWTPILSASPHRVPWASGPLLTLFPRLLGDKITSRMIPGGPATYPEMALGYFGILGAAAAIFFVRPGRRRRPAEIAFLAPIVFSLGAATGLWPIVEIASHLPGLGHMFPIRFLSWIALAGAAMAAFEADRLAQDLSERRDASVWTFALLAAGILAAALTYRHYRPIYAAAGSLAAERHAFLLAAGMLAAAGIVLAASLRGGRFARMGIPLWTLLAGAELFRQGMRLNPMSEPAAIYPETPLVRFLRTRPGPFRVAGIGAALFPDVGIFAGAEDVRTHDPVERRDYVEFLDATMGYDPAPYFKQIADPNAAALDFLNVRYLVAVPQTRPPSEKWTPVYEGPDGAVFENRNVLPRVRAPERIRVVRRKREGVLLEPAGRAYGQPYRALFEGLDWRREAVVLDDGDSGFRPASGDAGAAVEIRDEEETSNRAAFTARVARGTGNAIVVTSYVSDGGWRVHDETGARIATGRANGPFLALSVPPGEHRLTLDYATPGFRLGFGISLATALGAAAVAAARRARRPVRA